MSNRGRQCVASFLALDLQMDWRLGAQWFEHALLDYDLASNYGNWVCAAGVGVPNQRVNKFNVAKQAHYKRARAAAQMQAVALLEQDRRWRTMTLKSSLRPLSTFQ